MKHLKISIAVSKMLIPSMPIHFDSLIAAAAVKEYTENGGGTVEDYDQIIGHLPLEKYEEGGEWVWMSSVIRWSSFGKYMKSMTQSMDQYKLTRLRNEGVVKYGAKSLNTASGSLKSSISLLPSAAYSTGEVFCVGDKARIEELLSYVSHIGKKHQRGCGVVLSYTVSEVEENNLWLDRNIPLALKSVALADHKLCSNIGVRPPYWINKNKHRIGLGVAG